MDNVSLCRLTNVVVLLCIVEASHNSCCKSYKLRYFLYLSSTWVVNLIIKTICMLSDCPWFVSRWKLMLMVNGLTLMVFDRSGCNVNVNVLMLMLCVRSGCLMLKPFLRVQRVIHHVCVISMLTWAASWLDGQDAETLTKNSMVTRHPCRVNRDLLCASFKTSSQNSCRNSVEIMVKLLWNSARWRISVKCSWILWQCSTEACYCQFCWWIDYHLFLPL